MITVKGWCPGALKPMMSGDGLIVRVRAWQGRLSAEQAAGVADLAARFGSGLIDLTSRANLQIRGVRDYQAVLDGMAALGLLDDSVEVETRRNILTQPFWEPGDLTDRLGRILLDVLPMLPDLPPKFGFALDTGAEPVLRDDPADIRLERIGDALYVRRDGATVADSVSEEDAVPVLFDVAQQFASMRAPDQRRMRDFVSAEGQSGDVLGAYHTQPGPCEQGFLAGIPFGALTADDLRRAAEAGSAIRLTPWRMVLIEGAAQAPEGWLGTPDPRLTADACPGAPYCQEASVETRPLALELAPVIPGLHVSGCTKGCARARPAKITLVGRDGRFDLVKNGLAGDTPTERGLTPNDLPQAIG
ncbi:cobalamin biosynthesis protein CobG [Palleronia caenipelagi]|uniref:Cobalamin biosynthesis protein CobG n=1 Tax=Palleronia caenipelagi TaxID=2489174 RepID=A0A547Q8G4_9RHOB|nr:cobalamin biosynthesis protein CobG [Palleronia caenipelagi]TRD22672.1 cobalamin biosynthesis protein CobG [Palleronia caenipelagi]